LANAFFRLKSQPRVDQMKQVHLGLRKALPKLMRDAGTRSVFTARVFHDLRVQAQDITDRHIT
jgi:hypothetical protein